MSSSRRSIQQQRTEAARKSAEEFKAKQVNAITKAAKESVAETGKHVNLALASGYRFLYNLDLKSIYGGLTDLVNGKYLSSGTFGAAKSLYAPIKSALKTKSELEDLHQDLIELILFTDRVVASLKTAADNKLPLCSMREVGLIVELIINRIKSIKEEHWKNATESRKVQEAIGRDILLLTQSLSIINNEIAVVEAALNSAHAIKDVQKRILAIRKINERSCNSILFTEGELSEEDKKADREALEDEEEQEEDELEGVEHVAHFSFQQTRPPGGASLGLTPKARGPVKPVVVGPKSTRVSTAFERRKLRPRKPHNYKN